MSTRTLTLIVALPLLAACTDSEPVAPTADDAASILAAKGGKPGKPGGGGDGDSFSITTTDLGTLEGSSRTGANSVVSGPDGNSVRVVGKSGDLAFYWTPGGGMVELRVSFDPTASLKFAEANELNVPAQIVGKRFVDRGGPEFNGLQAIFWNSSTDLAIDLTTQARSNSANAINSSGVVVGQSFDHPDDPDAPHAHAMLWTVDGTGNVTTRDLHEETFGALGFLNSVAQGINDRTQVVGQAYDGIRERAFLWDNGVVTLLDGAVEPDFSSFAQAISNADPVQIIGLAHAQGGGSPRVLLWTVLSGGTVQTEELPPLAGFDWALATDLNDAGEVVGYSYSSTPTSNTQDAHATLWTFDPQTGERIAVDLGQGWAQAIDNSASLVGLTRVVGGTMVGKGRKKTNHAILWEVEPVS